MIKLYGSIMTSAHRCHVLLKELKVEWEEMPLDMAKGEHKSPDFLKLNPNGKVPCMVDGDFVLWESMAINGYLAKKYQPDLLGGTIENTSLINQWSFWSIVHVQPPLVEILMGDNAETRKRCTEAVLPMNEVLNAHLENRKYMLGDTFTLADINVGTVMVLNRFIKNDLSGFPNIEAWLDLLMTRPSFQ